MAKGQEWDGVKADREWPGKEAMVRTRGGVMDTHLSWQLHSRL